MKSSPVQEKIQQVSALVSSNKLEQAAFALDELVMLEGATKEENIQVGHLCMSLGSYVNAIEFFSRAVIEDPENALLLGFLGVAYLKNGQYYEAEGFLRKSVHLDDSLYEPVLNLASVLVTYRNFPEAMAMLEKAQQLKPSEPNVYANMAICQGEIGDYEGAITNAEKSIKLGPKNPYVHDHLGRLYTQLGQQDKAQKYFEKAISLDRTFGNAYEGLSAVRKFSSKDKPLIEKVKKVLKESMPPRHRAYINYCLGKMLNDCGEWDDAYSHYQQANTLMKKSNDYTPPYDLLSEFKKIFTRSFFSDNRVFGSESNVPVFIVGMPRSGTTLAEQIIASHPLASGMGELKEIGQIADEIVFAEGIKDANKFVSRTLAGDVIRQSAERYLNFLTSGSEGKQRITDKMPDNYIYLGVIALLFPNAKIVHMVRHPLDTALSCYFQPFSEMSWSYDLEWIAQRYKFYRKTMEFWKSVLPAGMIMDVHYEDLIEDTENKSRGLIDFIGLDWDDACLAFNKTERAVKTASLWQVRQPIYKTSKLRSRHYAKHLQGLAKDLSKYLQDDREMLAEWGLKLKPSWWPG